MSEAQPTVRGAGPDEARILRRFGASVHDLVGAGGEARVFALPDGEHVLRVCGGDSPHVAPELLGLLRSWAEVDLGFDLPTPVDTGRVGAQPWRVDRRMPGVPFDRWLAAEPDPARRDAALRSYLDVAGRLRRLPVADRRPGELLGTRWATLRDAYADRVRHGAAWGGDGLRALVPHLDERVGEVLDRLGEVAYEPSFVHGDLCPQNVMLSETPAGPRVTGVLDVSVHAMVADPTMDLVDAIAYIELIPYPGAYADAARLAPRLAELVGDPGLVTAYRRLGALYYQMDPGILPWCAAQFA